jgi:ABC-2 type transport system ATP-binding protein
VRRDGWSAKAGQPFSFSSYNGAMPAAIDARQLTRRFRHTDAVRDLSFSVPEGAICALLGPNAAGKTTTIKLLMNLLRPTQGAVAVLGRDSRLLDAAALQRIGYVSENQRLPDWMTPAQLFDYCRPLYAGWDPALARTLREMLGLAEERPLRQLSRGTRMKAALLASLAFRPALLVLDEPFTGLDPVVRDDLIEALLRPPGGRPWTVLVSSHDMHEVERLADRVVFIEGGRLLLEEPVDSLLARFPSQSLRDIFVTLARSAAGAPR